MNPKIFFENFGHLADAPNGIEKLRELILQLAVSGRLGTQDPKDEPAAKIIEKIKTEKQNLIKAKKIRPFEALPEIGRDETPNSVPNGWVWAQLDDLSLMVHYGYTASANHAIKDVKLLRITDIQNDKVEWDTVPGCEIDADDIADYELHTGDLLIARTGGTIGKTYLVQNVQAHAIFASYLIRVVPSTNVKAEYVKLFAESPLYWKQLYAKSMGTGQPNVNGTSLRSLLVPVPPLAEQKRIVVKVNKLMAVCDELEVQQKKRHETRLHLNNSAIDKLLNSQTPKEFTANWQRICDNFGLLYDHPDMVNTFRKAILQLAVQGKLVHQEPQDGTADTILVTVASERRCLIETGKLKKVSVNSENLAKPYRIPSSWVWAKLSDILLKVTDGTHHSPPNLENGKFKYITAKNIKTAGIDLSEITYVSREVHDDIYARCNPERGDILYIKDGATTGIATINTLEEPFSMLSSVALLKVPNCISNKFLLYALRSPYFYDNMRGDMSGIAITRVTLTKLCRAMIPLPPINEQKRIVAKVDQLMTLCDKLQTQLKEAQETSAKLTAAAVANLTAA